MQQRRDKKNRGDRNFGATLSFGVIAAAEQRQCDFIVVCVMLQSGFGMFQRGGNFPPQNVRKSFVSWKTIEAYCVRR